MANNLTRTTLKTFAAYVTHELDVEHTRGVNIHEIVLRLNALVTVAAGGGADGTVVEHGPARLISNIVTVHDGVNYVDNLSGRDLFLFGRRCHARVRELVGLAAPGVQTNTPIMAEIVITFSPKFAANPHELCIPAMPVQSQFRTLITLEAGKAVAGDSDGTAALLSGGTRATTISGFTLEVVELTSTSPIVPLYIPIFTKQGTDQFTVADAALDLQLNHTRPLAAQLFMNRYGALKLSQDGINTITLSASNTSKLQRISYEHLKGAELRDFPAVPTTEAGIVLLNYLDNGRLGQALNPSAFGSNPRFTFDVDAPTGSPGRIEVVTMELARRQPHTQ